MEDRYRSHSSISCWDVVVEEAAMTRRLDNSQLSRRIQFHPPETGSEVCDMIKIQIANHPLYPYLLSAYIQCRKVGAPPEMAWVLDQISKEGHTIGSTTQIEADPELDEFMESYFAVLHRYKEELSNTFEEATTFLSDIESQLINLCKEPLTDEGGGSSEELEAGESQESSGGYPGGRELKEILLCKYSGYLSSLRKDFLKKRNKGKLPKEARTALLHWWNTHYRWPYPTEEEKINLSEITGLDPKQINNWFINQRKRHWRPYEDIRFALTDGVIGNIQGRVYFDNVG